MKHKFVLYCKSYRGDLERVKLLSETIEKHNKENLPFIISVPEEDKELFESDVPYYTEVIADESYCGFNKGWHGQQFVKASFFLTEIAEYYLCIDSDSYFFKDFYLSDFMASEDTPYLIMHSHNVFWEWWDRYSYKFNFDARESYKKEYLSIKEHLGTGGKVQHYGPSPFIWDTKVWKWLNLKYGISNLFHKHTNELKWYGEGAIASGANFYPCAPLMACMHYKEQYKMYKEDWDYQEKHFHNQYLGIVMQSNWDAPLKF